MKQPCKPLWRRVWDQLSGRDRRSWLMVYRLADGLSSAWSGRDGQEGDEEMSLPMCSGYYCRAYPDRGIIKRCFLDAARTKFSCAECDYICDGPGRVQIIPEPEVSE